MIVKVAMFALQRDDMKLHVVFLKGAKDSFHSVLVYFLSSYMVNKAYPVVFQQEKTSSRQLTSSCCNGIFIIQTSYVTQRKTVLKLNAPDKVAKIFCDELCVIFMIFKDLHNLIKDSDR